MTDWHAMLDTKWYSLTIAPDSAYLWDSAYLCDTDRCEDVPRPARWTEIFVNDTGQVVRIFLTCGSCHLRMLDAVQK